MKEIKFIEIYTQDGIYDNAIVKYVDGTEETIDGFDAVCKKVREFAGQKKMTSRDLLDNPEYITILDKEKEEHLMDINEFVAELRRLNPTVNFELGDPTKDSEALSRFFSSVLPDKLVLPKGFEYNDKNEFTNKHHTTSGRYVTFRCEPLVKSDVKGTTSKKKSSALPATLAVVTSLAIASSIYSLFGKDFKGFFDTRKSTPKGETKTITQTVDIADTVSNGSLFPENFEVIRQDDKENSTLYYLVQKYSHGEMTSQMEFDNMLKLISNMCQTNMNDVTNFLKGKPFQENKDTVEFHNLFEEGSDTNVVLKEFDDLRKKIVDNTYSKNQSNVINGVNGYINEFINFFYRENVKKNGQYNVVSDNVELLGQYILYTMHMKMLEQPINYTVRLDGEVYDQDMLRERAYMENLELINNMSLRVNRIGNTR